MKSDFELPKRVIHLCTKFHGNPISSCGNISLKTTNVNLTVAVEEKSENHWDSSSGNHDDLYKSLCQSIEQMLRYDTG